MWSYGKTEWVPEDQSKTGDDDLVVRIDVIWGECSTFVEAMDLLYEKIVRMVDEGSETDMHLLLTLMMDIKDIKDDPGIRYDPDQWEDEEFPIDNGNIEYFVIQD